MSFNQMLDKTLTIYREQDAPDGMGGFEKAWAATEVIKGMVSPASSNTIIKYQGMNITVTHTVYVAPDAPIEAGDRLYFGTRVMEVKGKPKDPVERGHHLEIACEEVG